MTEFPVPPSADDDTPTPPPVVPDDVSTEPALAEDDTRPNEVLNTLDEPPVAEEDTRPNEVSADAAFTIDEPPLTQDDTQPTPLAPMPPIPALPIPTPPRPQPPVSGADLLLPAAPNPYGEYAPNGADLLTVAPQRNRRRWLVWMLIIGVVLIGAALIALLLLTSNTQARETVRVTVYADGQPYELATNVSTVREVLDAIGVTVNPNDALSHPPDALVVDGMEIYVDRARVVTLIVDGALRQVMTTRRDPLAILTDANITLHDDDRVWIDGTETEISALAVWPVPVTQITIRYAVTLVIVDGDTQREVRTTADTIGDALFEAGVTLFLADTVTPDLNTPPSEGMVVTVDRSRPVTITVDGESIETRVAGGTVADALAAAGVTLIGLDYTVPSESAAIVPGMSIRVIRVTEEVVVEQEPIPFQTVFQADASLELDQQQVVQTGQDGVLQRNIRVRYENGVEISRTEDAQFVAREPVNRVIAYGTAVVIRTLDTPEGPLQYWRVIRVHATSYHPAALGGDNITATGATLTKGIVGADPDLLPYHTRIYVPGYGIGQIEDTGGPRRSSRWIDLGYDDSNWVSWSREVDVYLLTPLPEDIIYILPP